MGIDGSGKTTLAHRLVAALKKKNKKAAYLNPYGYVFLNHFTKLFKKKKSKKNPLLGKTKRPRFFQLWPLFASVDTLFYFLLKIRPILRKNDYVVCDRYFYDLAASFDYYGYANKTTKKAYLRLVPTPALTVLLDLDEKKAYERKKEHPKTFYEYQRKQYLKLAKQLGFETINTEKKPSETEKQILRLIQKVG